MHLPLRTERKNILRHGVLRETVVAKGQEIRFLGNEVNSTILVDETDGNDIVALLEQSLRDIVATRRILIIGLAYLLTIQISNIMIEKRAQQETGGLSRVYLIYIYMLTKPNTADASPSPIVLVDNLPIVIVELGSFVRITRVIGIQQLLPLLRSLVVSLCLCLYIVIVLKELGLLNQLRIVALQGISRNPSLNGCSTPTIDDDALRNTRLFLHAKSQERTQGREAPSILLSQRLPLGRLDILTNTMGVCGIGNTEQTHLVVVKMVDFIGILRVNALNGNVHIRLTRTEPNIAHQYIRQHHVAHHHCERSTSFHLGQINTPTSVSISHSGILTLLPANDNLFTRVSLSPDRNRFSTLEHHARLEHLRELHFRFCCQETSDNG